MRVVNKRFPQIEKGVPLSFSADAAETLALQALGWLLSNEDLLPVFLGATGVNESDLRERASDPEFLGSVLDFLMMDDAWAVSYTHLTLPTKA